MNNFHSQPLRLNANTLEEKRLEIKEYFNNSCSLYERLFDMLKDDSVFYRVIEPTRHSALFYFAHSAVFFINKLILVGAIKERVNYSFEESFGVGVDEMNWDDLNRSRYSHISVNEVKEYRAKVKEIVLELIETMPMSLPITWEQPMWAILMAIEHERIHIETSSVLHRELPLEFVNKIEEFNVCIKVNKVVQNSLVTVSSATTVLGKSDDLDFYGWDNEYAEVEVNVDSFKVSKYLVSNAEYMEFVKEDGYKKEEYWCEEGKKFLSITKATHPPFWIKQSSGEFKLRVLDQEVELPLSFPVELSNLEAQAFLVYKSKKDRKNFALPSEAQYMRLYDRAGLSDLPDDTKANINIAHYYSSSSVDEFMFDDIADVIGNVWQHSSTSFYSFEGFKTHKIYDDFSTPTFDDKHAIIFGGSFISTGNEMLRYSRYAFRRHFVQHAGFRYVEVEK
ncbi:MAG: 5-histidylcysteine sulfoxide synthase [Helicobacteraceae bacterium]|nr:5-histidylcysteine sulfoxide synthase [Helicobacteraceae bacterium]